MINNPLILSNEHILTTNTNANLHTLVISPSGGGKTVSYLEPNLLHCGEDNLIVRVSKRSLVEKYKPFFKEKGYRVCDLNLAHPEQVNGDSVCYDPMACVTDESTAHLFAERIVNMDDTRGTSADPYWQSAATQLLESIIFLVLSENNAATFASVLACFSNLTINDVNSDGIIQTSLSDRFDYLEDRAPSHPAIRAWRSFATLPYRTAGCVYGSLASVLQMYSKQLQDSIKNLPSFNVERFCKEKSILFITANATDISKFKISNLLFEDLTHSLIEESEINGGTLKRKTRIIIDDFGVAGTIESIPAALSFVREAGISFSLLCQSITQLNNAYGTAKAGIIRNNCDNTIYIGAPNDLETAEQMAIKMNLPVLDMLSLKPDKAVICRRGHPAVISKRYKTLEDPLYLKITRTYDTHYKKSTLVERKQRKDFSPAQEAIDSVNDLTQEVETLSKKLEKKFDELFGSLVS